MNAITYKEFFPLLKDNKIWIGNNSVKSFLKPNKTIQDFGNVCWFTNIDHAKRHQMLPLDLGYTYVGHEDMYQKYDNYDAINVDKVSQIPCDYTECMGVPITFLDKYCPEQFEIINANDIRKDKVLVKFKSHGLIKDAEATIVNNCSQNVNVERRTTYARIVIKRKSG